MFRMTIHRSVDEVAHVAAANDCDCDIDEGDDEDCCVVRMEDHIVARFVGVLARLGWRWHIGRTKPGYADPTFARASDHLAQRTRVLHGQVIS